MNDFSELENELKQLRPARPSPVLFERVEQALADRRVRPSLVVVRLRPRSRGGFGFGFVGGNQSGTPPGARRNNRANFTCA